MKFQRASQDGGGSTYNANVNGSSVAATGVLTLTGNMLDTETVTIGTKVYTFQDTLTDVDGNVHIGATASDTLDNLIDAINLGAGAGTDYASSMTLHPDVSGAAGAGDTMDATAKVAGSAGNSIATTETGTNSSWGAATLEGGNSPAEFHIGGDSHFEVQSLVVFLRDGTVNDGDFGAISGALSNGVKIEVQNDSDTVINDLLDGAVITINRDFYKYSPKVEKGTDWLQAFIPLDAGISLPFGYKIVVTVQDDITGLDELYIYATGAG